MQFLFLMLYNATYSVDILTIVVVKFVFRDRLGRLDHTATSWVVDFLYVIFFAGYRLTVAILNFSPADYFSDIFV